MVLHRPVELAPFIGTWGCCNVRVTPQWPPTHSLSSRTSTSVNYSPASRGCLNSRKLHSLTRRFASLTLARNPGACLMEISPEGLQAQRIKGSCRGYQSEASRKLLVSCQS